MIRPATCLTMLLAADPGLYLYQTKHQAYVLDRQIDVVVQDTGKIHAHIAVLRAEYALMSDPSRLQQLAGTYLPALVPPTPAQFTTLDRLDERLPAVAPPPAAPPPLVVASAVPAPLAAIAAIAREPADDLPPPPAPKAVPAVVTSLAAPASPGADATQADAAAHATPHPVAKRAARTIVASARPVRRPVAIPRPDPYAIQAAAPPMPAAAPQGGSVLGMARSMPAPAYATHQRYRPGESETVAQ